MSYLWYNARLIFLFALFFILYSLYLSPVASFHPPCRLRVMGQNTTFFIKYRKLERIGLKKIWKNSNFCQDPVTVQVVKSHIYSLKVIEYIFENGRNYYKMVLTTTFFLSISLFRLDSINKNFQWQINFVGRILQLSFQHFFIEQTATNRNCN